MSEDDLERALRELLDERGLYGYHPRVSKGSAPGWPDWVILGCRRVLFRELKSDYGHLTPEQRRVGYALQAAGQDFAVWRPADLEAGRIAAELDALTY